jgi:hypothetical protein
MDIVIKNEKTMIEKQQMKEEGAFDQFKAEIRHLPHYKIVHDNINHSNDYVYAVVTPVDNMELSLKKHV